MSLQVYPPNIIISMIINEFFKYRNITLDGNKSFSSDEINADMDKIGYVQIEGTNKNPRGIRDKIIVIVMKSNDNKNNTTSDMKFIKNIIQLVKNTEYYKQNKLDEFFLILNKEHFGKKNFEDIVNELYAEQKGGLDIKGEKPYYSIFPYEKFVVNVPESNIIPRHELMSTEEVDDLLTFNRCSYTDIMVILTNEVSIIWNGGRPGQMVKIYRNSESALISIAYRRIESHIKIPEKKNTK